MTLRRPPAPQRPADRDRRRARRLRLRDAAADPAAASRAELGHGDQGPRHRVRRDRGDSDAPGRAWSWPSAYFGQNQMTTALDQVKLAIAADPNYGEAYNLRGLIYANLGDTVLAEESFKRALQLNPRDADTMHNYGYYLCQQKRYPRVERAVRAGAGGAALCRRRPHPADQGVCLAYAGQLRRGRGGAGAGLRARSDQPVHLDQPGRGAVPPRRLRAGPLLHPARQRLAAGLERADLWLAARIEHKLGNWPGTTEFGRQLRNRFPESREAAAFARGAFDE